MQRRTLLKVGGVTGAGLGLTPPNENNDLLRRGALKLGIAAAAIQRNVRGCWNLGSCGLGCPTNAKQSMLVPTIPSALDRGELQSAAGARQVAVGHELAPPYASWSDARAHIPSLPMQPLLTKVVSAHVMGGCGMAVDASRGVVRPDGTHWQITNLSVHDGSLFPTSIGANPQLSVYGLTNRLATRLAKRLAGRGARLAI